MTDHQPTAAQRQAAIDVERSLWAPIVKMAPFRDRRFSDRTIEALIKAGIDAPERLLFMEERDLKKIPGVGKASLAEIMTYRARFKREGATG